MAEAGMIDYSQKSVWFKFFYVRWFYQDYSAEFIKKYVPKLLTQEEYEEIISLPQIEKPLVLQSEPTENI